MHDTPVTTASRSAGRPLLRILGLGFGLAIGFGSTIGTGILRLPGMVAATLGDRTLIVGLWLLGGIYAVMGAMAVAELAAQLPQAGGFRVYARHAYGERVGFVIGWCDWLMSVAAIAYSSIAAVTFLGTLWKPASASPVVSAIFLLTAVYALHWTGLRLGSWLTSVISLCIGTLLIALVIGCLLVAPASDVPASLPNSAASLPWSSFATVLVIVPAIRAVLTAFDGWYSPIYMAEENADQVRTLPRAIIGGTILIACLYVLINVALLHAMPLPVLAASALPAADAAQRLWPYGGAVLVTVFSILTLFSLLSNIMLVAPRILFSLGRDGLLNEKTAVVSDGGTPRTALSVTYVTAFVMVLSGTFEQVLELFAVLFLLCYVSAFLAVFVLRLREPARPRQFRDPGYPVTTGIVLLGTIAFLVAAVIESPRSGVLGLAFVGACLPAYAWLANRRTARAVGAQP